MKRIVAEETIKHLEAINEVNEAREILEKEAAGRLKAEDHAKEQSSQKRMVMEAVLSIDNRYRRYSREEIAAATDDFSPEKQIGEGGYGSVYKAFLDHTPVAVKVLREGAAEKMEEFMREVEVLCGLHHPNIVLLLGACPEIGCIVYEYMENGSLQDQLSRRGGAPPLPWCTRFRVLFEVARALAYLHGSSPEPVIHRDLKPGNILLDRNFVGKIGDVGLAKFMPRVVPDGETEFRETVIAGTLHYMDPEYQRTGTLRPKSDLYAFGIIALQLLTGRPPAGLAVMVENAVGGGSLAAVLDPSVPDWPFPEAEKLAEIALRCTQLRCRDRPELEADVLPVLERLSAAADGCPSGRGPAHFLCPILKMPMEDPYIAADGFTYEYRAIRAWLAENQTSPVTQMQLPDATIIPNHSLRLAIEEWRSL
ncbi:unnamed protein product [Spirodela intermedia]|uniref:RING-type E3 ubiquitin transferase n=1 Tax=Spirodela intermedia TaxID=51605 RepID=A0A7I8KJA7_SPIIN|nr:unnamed protein product [Spirodela intermedia]